MKKKIIILIVIFLVLGILIYYFVNNTSSSNNETNQIQGNVTNSVEIENDEKSNTIESANGSEDISELEYFVLYNGKEISIDMNVQEVTDGMDINDSNAEKYNITYYNFESGNYIGSSDGSFGKDSETYDGIAYVDGVSKLAFSEYFDAIPRQYEIISELPEELEYLSEYTSFEINKIDLDGDNNSEYIVCYTYEKEAEDTEDGEPIASSYIMLLDSNYEKIANLVNLENGYWANIKDPIQKILLSLEDDVEYIDIDNDGIMEIIVNIPKYEGTKISILKYNDGSITGETDIDADLMP